MQSSTKSSVPYIIPDGGVGEPFSHSLSFDSNFESGNLLRTIQVGEMEYDLFLRSDLHTTRGGQWFYFSVTNTHPPPVELPGLPSSSPRMAHSLSSSSIPVSVSFNIVNMTKPDSLFNQGMRPVMYSLEDAKTKNIGWVRAGRKISYSQAEKTRVYEAKRRFNTMFTSQCCGQSLPDDQTTFASLSFTIDFQNDGDTYLIAYCFPYTYSDYRSFIDGELAKEGIHHKMRRRVLTKSISNLECDLLTITNFSSSHHRHTKSGSSLQTLNGGDFGDENVGRSQKKKAVILSGRVHPGETPASWMMEGFIKV